jgi:hypothetical protein
LSDQQIQASQHLAREVWGHLPDKLKEEMQQAFKEGTLPKYQVMIEKYFRAIAEQNDSRK